MPFEKHVLKSQLAKHILVAASCEEAEGAGKNALQLVEVRQLAVADHEVGAETEADVQIVFQLLVLQLYLLSAHRGGKGKGALQRVAVGGVEGGESRRQHKYEGEDSISHRCRGLVWVSFSGC